MNQLDQLIRELEGADYYHDEEETKLPLWQGFLPIVLGGAAIAAYCLYQLVEVIYG